MVTKASLIIEYNGEACAVLLNDINLDFLVNTIACLSINGKMQAVRLDKSFRWESLETLLKKI